MSLLLELLRGHPLDPIVTAVEWDCGIALAQEHRILPFLAGTSLQSGRSLPPEINARLIQSHREAQQYSFLQSSELQQLLQAFAASSIPVLPLKGPSLAQRIYGDASLRISCDHDLLVHREDFARASLLLRTLDFAPDAMPDDYHQKWSRGGTVVELHFDVENPLAIDFDVTSAWINARQANFRGQPIWQLAPHDELRYLCLHGVRHRFARLSFLLDIALASKQLEPPRDLQRPTPARLDQASSIMVLGCAIARKLELGGLHTPSLPPVPKTGSSLERLIETLWADLLTKPATKQDWQSIHAFYLELEPSRSSRFLRRLRHLQILLPRLIDDDFRFAARCGFTRTWQVRLLRPVRLALQRRNRTLSVPRT